MGDMALTQEQILQQALVSCGTDKNPDHPHMGLYRILNTAPLHEIVRLLSNKLMQQGYRVSKDFTIEK